MGRESSLPVHPGPLDKVFGPLIGQLATTEPADWLIYGDYLTRAHRPEF